MKEMRRSNKQLTDQEAKTLLNACEYGILSTVDQAGQPYGVPLSYTYNNNGIYFHSALTGHKLDNIAQNSKSSFCVVGKTTVLPDKFGTEYESAIAFGTISEVSGAEWQNAMLWLVEKYSADFKKEGEKYIEKHAKATKVFKMEIIHLTGKAGR